MSLKVCFTVGDNETPHCGVKDYTYRLAEALRERNVVADVCAPAKWDLASFRRFRSELRERRYDVIHVQYPSVGVRGSLVPHCLGLAAIAPVCCVTIHEYISKGAVQKACTQLFRISSKTILFTTDLERKTFEQYLKEIGPPHVTLGIGSNVPAAPPRPVKEPVVLYFGQIRAEKGLEAFLELAQLSIARAKEYRFQLFGASLPRQTDYVRGLQAKSPPNVEWLIGRPLAEISEGMSRSLAAYLPFPDGAGFRRGSLLGSLVNGLPVISKVSAITPPSLANVLLPAENAEQALAHLDALIQSPESAASRGEAGRLLALPFSWSSIAEAHQSLYESLIIANTAYREPVISKRAQPQPR